MRTTTWAPMVLLASLGCGGATLPGSDATADAAEPAPAGAPPAASAAHVEAPPERTWPPPEAFTQTEAELARPWTLAVVRHEGQARVALARREGGRWMLSALIGQHHAPGCASLPCPWPAALVPETPLAEPAPLGGEARSAVVYARTLLSFEGPLVVATAPADFDADDPGSDLERLRRYQPMGRCSMDTLPQEIAMRRARAAAEARRTGWAVQGWIDTVAYFSSDRVAWSSYGQSHPDRHLELLSLVGVDPEKLLLGLVVSLPGLSGQLHLADVRRIVPDLGPGFAAWLRTLAADATLDPYNRALLTAAVAELPLASDPLYAQLPRESQALLDVWSR